MPPTISQHSELRQLSRQLSLHLAGAGRQIEHLASGLRLNRASDDPASLALANGINAEIRALAEGGRNVQQSVHLLQVAEGSLSEISDMVRRMQDLAVQASSSTYNDADRTAANGEFQALKEEIERIAESTRYNDLPLLASDEVFTIQAGPTEVSNDVSSITLGDMRATGPRLNLASATIDTMISASGALDVLKQAQTQVIEERNRIGAFQNRLSMSATTTASVIERMGSTESAIRDADTARAVTELSRSQILAEASASMARQSGTDVERLLALLR
ncbi:MAG: flagellin [Candidatus Latescibacterota bacterium]|jgi:flagellin